MASVVLCDLGGVVADVDAARCHRAWARLADVPVERTAALFPGPAYEEYERGGLTSEQFIDHVASSLGVPSLVDEIADAFVDIYSGVTEEVVSVLASVREVGVPLSALTNTCELHQRRASVLFAETYQLFDTVHRSYELGVRKPDLACFRRVLDIEGREPADVVFVDDLPENVQAAEQLGITGVVFTSADQLARDLEVALA